MIARRLRRLSMLTHGAALVGLAACNKEAAPPEAPHVNAPAPMSSAEGAPTTAPVVASASTVAPPDEPKPPNVNSPPTAEPNPPNVNAPKPPKHTNSPPK